MAFVAPVPPGRPAFRGTSVSQMPAPRQGTSLHASCPVRMVANAPPSNSPPTASSQQRPPHLKRAASPLDNGKSDDLALMDSVHLRSARIRGGPSPWLFWARLEILLRRRPSQPSSRCLNSVVNLPWLAAV